MNISATMITTSATDTAVRSPTKVCGSVSKKMTSLKMGAGPLRIFKDVIFFETLPQTFVGLRTAVSVALVVIIVAEMFIGAVDGLGHRIIDAQISYQLTDMYGSILVAGAMGYGANLLFLVVEKLF